MYGMMTIGVVTAGGSAIIEAGRADSTIGALDSGAFRNTTPLWPS